MPVEITDIDEFQAMDADLTGDYEIMNAIDGSDTTTWTDADGAGWIPIGWGVGNFTGTLEGNDYPISDVYTERGAFDNTKQVALFGNGANNPGTISNLNLVDINFICDGGNKNVGLISGVSSGATLTNVHVTGTVTITPSVDYVGLAFIRKNIADCSVDVIVSGGLDASGFAYIGEGCSTVTRCRAKGSLSASGSVAGFSKNLDIRFNNVTFTNCYTQVALEGGDSEDIGGWYCTVADSTNNKVVTLQDCYAANAVTVGTGQNIKGLACAEPAITGTLTVNDSFWDTDIGAATTEGGGTGETTTNMKDFDTFDTATWDIEVIGSWTIEAWSIDDGVDYPLLAFETVTGGGSVTGTSALAGAAAMVSSAGTVLVDGTSALAGSSAAMSSSGAVAVSGVASLAGVAATIASSGQVLVDGTSSLDGSAASLSSAGEVAVAGTSALAGSSAEIAAVGAVLVTGAAVFVGGSANTSSSGTVLVLGNSTLAGTTAVLDASGLVGAAVRTMLGENEFVLPPTGMIIA